MEQYEFSRIIDLKRQGRYFEAERSCKNAIDGGDYNPLIFSHLAEIFFLQEKYQKGLNCCALFFKIVTDRGNNIESYPKEIFLSFMTMIRNTDLVVYMERNGIDGENIIWRLRNIMAISAYCDSISGNKNGSRYENFEIAKSIFMNNNCKEKIFTINSIRQSFNQYRGVPLSYLCDSLL